MNIRNIALVAALVSVAAVSNAQSFEIRAGAGTTVDQATRTVRVNPGAQFTIELWFNNGSSAVNSTLASMGLAFDRLANTGTVQVATNSNAGLDKKLAPVFIPTGLAPGGTPPTMQFTVAGGGWNSAIVGTNAPSGVTVNGSTTDRANWFTRAPISWSTTSGNITAYRPLVLASQQSPAGVSIAANASLLLATVTFTNALALGEIYGDDANEAGLQFYTPNTGNPSFGHTNFSGAGNTPGGAKYRVEAVPEPMTMAALGAGLALMARRRRKS